MPGGVHLLAHGSPGGPGGQRGGREQPGAHRSQAPGRHGDRSRRAGPQAGHRPRKVKAQAVGAPGATGASPLQSRYLTHAGELEGPGSGRAGGSAVGSRPAASEEQAPGLHPERRRRQNAPWGGLSLAVTHCHSSPPRIYWTLWLLEVVSGGLSGTFSKEDRRPSVPRSEAGSFGEPALACGR